MKKILSSLLLVLLTLEIYSQERNYFSTEFDANYFYYFVGNDNTNNFNYGFSFLCSKYMHKLKLSTGVNYSTKSYYSQEDIYNSIAKREYNLRYLNIPIIANIDLISQKELSISLLTGFGFNNIVYYSIETYFLNGDSENDNDLLQAKKMGVTYMLGTTFSKSIGEKFILNLSPIANYKLIPDYTDQRPIYKNIPNDRLSLGFRIGIEYLIKSSDNE